MREPGVSAKPLKYKGERGYGPDTSRKTGMYLQIPGRPTEAPPPDR
jgi:hypothetical protein